MTPSSSTLLASPASIEPTLALVSESAVASWPDLLRLVVVPVFAWAALEDVRTRRIDNLVWVPLALLGAVLLVWDGWRAWEAGGLAWSHDFLIPAAISLGVVVPLAYLFWRMGGFGGADAKALFVLALLLPTYPAYSVGGRTLPIATTDIGAFSFSILTNAAILAIVIPLALLVRNALAGRIGLVAAIGWPIPVDRVPETHGRLLETPAGISQGGLDLDALRMYLRWRGLSFEAFRENPSRYRDPDTIPDEPNPPTDGAVDRNDGAVAKTDGGRRTVDGVDESDGDGTLAGDATSPGEGGGAPDPWGADAFLDDIEGNAYGTAPEDLREGLEVLSEAETVWITPGTPFLVPIFAGLLVALFYGDLLLAVVAF